MPDKLILLLAVCLIVSSNTIFCYSLINLIAIVYDIPKISWLLASLLSIVSFLIAKLISP